MQASLLLLSAVYLLSKVLITGASDAPSEWMKRNRTQLAYFSRPVQAFEHAHLHRVCDVVGCIPSY